MIDRSAPTSEKAAVREAAQRLRAAYEAAVPPPDHDPEAVAAVEARARGLAAEHERNIAALRG